MLFSLDIIIYLSFNICIVKIMFHLIDATKWSWYNCLHDGYENE